MLQGDSKFRGSRERPSRFSSSDFSRSRNGGNGSSSRSRYFQDRSRSPPHQRGSDSERFSSRRRSGGTADLLPSRSSRSAWQDDSRKRSRQSPVPDSKGRLQASKSVGSKAREDTRLERRDSDFRDGSEKRRIYERDVSPSEDLTQTYQKKKQDGQRSPSQMSTSSHTSTTGGAAEVSQDQMLELNELEARKMQLMTLLRQMDNGQGGRRTDLEGEPASKLARRLAEFANANAESEDDSRGKKKSTTGKNAPKQSAVGNLVVLHDKSVEEEEEIERENEDIRKARVASRKMWQAKLIEKPAGVKSSIDFPLPRFALRKHTNGDHYPSSSQSDSGSGDSDEDDYRSGGRSGRKWERKDYHSSSSKSKSRNYSPPSRRGSDFKHRRHDELNQSTESIASITSLAADSALSPTQTTSTVNRLRPSGRSNSFGSDKSRLLGNSVTVTHGLHSNSVESLISPIDFKQEADVELSSSGFEEKPASVSTIVSEKLVMVTTEDESERPFETAEEIETASDGDQSETCIQSPPPVAKLPSISKQPVSTLPPNTGGMDFGFDLDEKLRNIDAKLGQAELNIQKHEPYTPIAPPPPSNTSFRLRKKVATNLETAANVTQSIVGRASDVITSMLQRKSILDEDYGRLSTKNSSSSEHLPTMGMKYEPITPATPMTEGFAFSSTSTPAAVSSVLSPKNSQPLPPTSSRPLHSILKHSTSTDVSSTLNQTHPPLSVGVTSCLSPEATPISPSKSFLPTALSKTPSLNSVNLVSASPRDPRYLPQHRESDSAIKYRDSDSSLTSSASKEKPTISTSQSTVKTASTPLASVSVSILFQYMYLTFSFYFRSLNHPLGTKVLLLLWHQHVHSLPHNPGLIYSSPILFKL